MTAPRTVAIIGAGFCGATLAVNLLRTPANPPLHVVLIERAQFARGLAYTRRKHPYLLNVPAGRMSANPQDAGEFLDFVRRAQPQVTAGQFLPRETYGDYLESLLHAAESAAAPGTALRRMPGVAVALQRAHRRPGYQVYLADGRSLHADQVVLATGNPPPGELPVAAGLNGSARYIADPWQAVPRLRGSESVLVIGTGLTMADVVLAGVTGASGVQFHAISRRGLMPAAQLPGPAESAADALSPAAVTNGSLVRLSREVRRAVRECAQRGDDWRAVIGRVRDLAPSLWQQLPARAQRQFVRHLRPYWDVHRHRLPGSTANTLQAMRHDGRLHVHAGRLLSLAATGKSVEVTYQPRGQRAQAVLRVDRVINCTGPEYDVTRTRERILRGLLSQGMAAPDPLRLGLMTDDIGRLISASGEINRNLYYLGPMLRARDWESTAVTELRSQSLRLARHLAAARPEESSALAARALGAGHVRGERSDLVSHPAY